MTLKLQIYAAVKGRRSYPFSIDRKHVGWVDAPKDGKLARIRVDFTDDIAIVMLDALQALDGTEYASLNAAEHALKNAIKD